MCPVHAWISVTVLFAIYSTSWMFLNATFHCSICLAYILCLHYHFRNLVSLDLWRWREVTNHTVKVLAENCPNLQELDVGWWYVYCIHLDHRYRILVFINCTQIQHVLDRPAELYHTIGKEISSMKFSCCKQKHHSICSLFHIKATVPFSLISYLEFCGFHGRNVV